MVNKFLLLCVVKKKKTWDTISEKCLQELNERCPHLEEFYLSHFSSENLHAVRSSLLPSHLTKLSLTASYIPVHWFAAASQHALFNHLVKVDVSNSSSLRDSDLADLATALNLEQLNLTGCYRLTDDSIRMVADNFKCLSSLNVGGLVCISNDAVVYALACLNKLSQLDLSDCEVTDDIFATCPRAPLRSLSVARCMNVSNVLLSHLLLLDTLTDLNVIGTNVSTDVSAFYDLQARCRIHTTCALKRTAD